MSILLFPLKILERKLTKKIKHKLQTQKIIVHGRICDFGQAGILGDLESTTIDRSRKALVQFYWLFVLIHQYSFRIFQVKKINLIDKRRMNSLRRQALGTGYNLAGLNFRDISGPYIITFCRIKLSFNSSGISYH